MVIPLPPDGRIGYIRPLSAALSVLLVLLAAGCTVAYFRQDRMIFPGAWMELAPPDPGGIAGAEPVEMEAVGGAVLRGWLLKAGGGGQAPLFVYYGGNAEEVVSYAVLFRERLPGFSILLLNYRGYGKSTGTPSEDAILDDALMAYDAFAQRPDTDPGRVVVMGRSLGTGVAVYVASKRPVAAVVLVSPYDSMRELAARHYPAVPSSMLRHPFESLPRARRASPRMLAVLGSADRIIPMSHSMRLVSAWRGPKNVLELAGAGHNDIFAHPGFWPGVTGFINSAPGAAR